MTNNKRYQPGFRAHELEPSVALALVQDDDLYDLYTDGLILIHDLISPLSSEAANARFTADEIDAQIDNIRAQITAQLEEAFALLPNTILDNILGNYNLARQFRSEAETSEDRFAVQTSATQFTRSLMQIYTSLRTLSRFIAPTDFE